MLRACFWQITLWTCHTIFCYSFSALLIDAFAEKLQEVTVDGISVHIHCPDVNCLITAVRKCVCQKMPSCSVDQEGLAAIATSRFPVLPAWPLIQRVFSKIFWQQLFFLVWHILLDRRFTTLSLAMDLKITVACAV
jgi:hypothetical protein